MELPQIVPRDAGQRLGRSAARQPVRVEAIDEPIEHRGRDVVRVVGVHLLRRRDLLFLPFDFLRRERRIAGDIRHQVHRQVEGVLHDDGADRGEVVAGARPRTPPIESI